VDGLRAGGGIGVSGDKKLRELLSTLFHYRSELESAEIRGDEFVAANARRLIQTQYAVIRNHCKAMGLPLPADVPAQD
jgi:hypothetical protein